MAAIDELAAEEESRAIAEDRTSSHAAGELTGMAWLNDMIF